MGYTGVMRATARPSLDPADYPFTHPIRTRFAETDAMGIVHHSAYLPYLEEARVAYMRDLGRSYAALHEAGTNLSVVEAWVGYRVPVRFDEVIDIGVVVADTARAWFQIAYLLTVDGAVRATAVTVHGAVGNEGRPQRLPDWLREPQPG